MGIAAAVGVYDNSFKHWKNRETFLSAKKKKKNKNKKINKKNITSKFKGIEGTSSREIAIKKIFLWVWPSKNKYVIEKGLGTPKRAKTTFLLKKKIKRQEKNSAKWGYVFKD